MKEETQRIKELLIKYRENRCIREEYEELIELAQNPGNEAVIKAIALGDWENQTSGIPKPTLPATNFRRRKWITAFKAAAAIALIIIAGWGLSHWLSEGTITFTTGNGEVREIILPDGSEVTLNANSNLTWVPTSEKREDRLVKLSGEAFFEVVKEMNSKISDSEYRGFRVVTPNMIVHVLGTSFNVSAREQQTEVFLQEGSVELELPEEEDVTQRMIPGDKVILNNRTGNLMKKDSAVISTSASWVTGILNYKDKSMEDVLKNLSDIFGVLITCQDTSLLSKKINLGVPYMDWENTKRALEMAIGLEFLKKGDSYTVLHIDRHE